MTDESIPGDAKAFAAYAEFDIRRWQLIRGERIVHTRFGEGVIQDVAQPTTQTIMIVIHFTNDRSTRLFDRTFNDPTIITSLTAPRHVWREVATHKERHDEQAKLVEERETEEKRRLEHLRKEYELRRQAEEPLRREAELRRLEKQKEAEEQRLERVKASKRQRQEAEKRRREAEEQRAQEKEAAAEFAQLKRKYFAESFADPSPISPLYSILQTFDQTGELSKSDETWLREAEVFGTLAYYYAKLYSETGNIPLLLSACRNWRKAGYSERVLELTLNADAIGNSDYRSKLLTTRGGAFRDLDQLDDAAQCANEAILLSKDNSYSYRLRGAIFFQRGQAEQGYEDFAEADRLDEQAGLTPIGRTRKEMENALEKANVPDQKFVAEFLIQKDPEKFRWARYYLNHPEDENR